MADDAFPRMHACVCPQEVGPFVTALVEQRCCAQLAQVVELFRPAAAVCIVPNFLVFRCAPACVHVGRF